MAVEAHRNVLRDGRSGDLQESARLKEEQEGRAAFVVEDNRQHATIVFALCIGTRARTTYENALFTKELMDTKFPNTETPFLVITSAYHMPRTSACFRKQGLHFDTFCVDYIGEKTRFVPESMFLPDRLGFYRWERLIKQWVGIFMYWMKGYL